MVIDDQRFIVTGNIDGEPTRTSESAAYQLQVSCVRGILRYATPDAATGNRALYIMMGTETDRLMAT